MSDEKTFVVKHRDTGEERTVTARQWREQDLAGAGFPAPPDLLQELERLPMRRGGGA